MTMTPSSTPVTLSTSRSAGRRARAPWFHLLGGERLLVWLVEGSQLFAIDREFAKLLDRGDATALAELEQVTRAGPRTKTTFDLEREPRAVSLALAQTCNLSCSYCYADRGRFGGDARRMPTEVARKAVERMLAGADGRAVTLGFIGGEVLLHRDALHAIVRYAQDRADEMRVPIGFSITTNGTLVTPDDVHLFRDHAFTVTVSVDGGIEVNDRHRLARAGESSFERALAGVGDLLADPGKAKVGARATVTRDDLRVHERVAALAAVGFPDIGVSPLRTGPDTSLRFRSEDWLPFLAEMVRAADAEVERVRGGGPPRLTNLAVALKEIHAGSARPLPCGSALSYVAVGAGGDYWTCHRTVDDPRYRLGDVADGPSRSARQAFLERRVVDEQEPCRSCWARYLCGGGCHAEVGEIGRAGCDYVRGWLEHCITVYADCGANSPSVLHAMGVGA